VAKAKELRPFVERLITVAKRGIADGPEGGRVLSARRTVARDLADREVTRKLFDTIAPRFATRPGGYTRLIRGGRRQGDQAEIAYVELVGSEYSPESESDSSKKDEQAPQKEGVGGRLRKAAQRIRGGGSKKSKKDSDSSGESTEN
jgi:large subunit ribosomal protein L17